MYILHLRDEEVLLMSKDLKSFSILNAELLPEQLKGEDVTLARYLAWEASREHLLTGTQLKQLSALDEKDKTAWVPYIVMKHNSMSATDDYWVKNSSTQETFADISEYKGFVLGMGAKSVNMQQLRESGYKL